MMFDMTTGELRYFKGLLENKQYASFVAEVDTKQAIGLLEMLDMKHLIPELRLECMLQGNMTLFNVLS